MKKTALLLASAILLTSCASKTLIQSNPTGAKVYIEHVYVGETPYAYSDTKIVGSKTDIRLEKEGYKTLSTSFSRNEKADVGAIIGGVFVLFPFLWTMKYNKERMYELQPVTEAELAKEQLKNNPLSLKDKLIELKKLFDENLISKEEYEQQKEKLLKSNSL